MVRIYQVLRLCLLVLCFCGVSYFILNEKVIFSSLKRFTLETDLAGHSRDGNFRKFLNSLGNVNHPNKQEKKNYDFLYNRQVFEHNNNKTKYLSKSDIRKNSLVATVRNHLENLDNFIEKTVAKGKIYANDVFNAFSVKHIYNFISSIFDFNKKHPIRSICEIGFGAGHGATLFLLLSQNASYTGFDSSDRYFYQDVALEWIRNAFKRRQITMIKGNTTVTVPEFKGSCDVIHIGRPFKGLNLRINIVNMARLASNNNLLLIDDCLVSWPEILESVKHLENNNIASIKAHIAYNGDNASTQKGWCVGQYKKPFVKIEKYDVSNSFIFLNKTFCNPSLSGKKFNIRDYKPCCNLSDECFNHNETWVLSVSYNRWSNALNIFDRNESLKDKINVNEENSFEGYSVLPNNLGHFIEIMPGPFSQSQTILKNKNCSSVTFLEWKTCRVRNPVRKFMTKPGKLEGFPTVIVQTPINELFTERKFDTIIMINIFGRFDDIEALNILDKTIGLLKVNGTFIWHEKFWDNYTGFAVPSEERELLRHPLRIKFIIASQVIKFFDPLFMSRCRESDQAKVKDCVNFIGRKKDITSFTRLPERYLCRYVATGRQTIVFFISHFNATILFNEINMANNSPNTEKVIIIETTDIGKDKLQGLFKKVQFQILLSFHHFKNWQNELSFYATPCQSIISHVSAKQLVGIETLCVGNSRVTVILMGYSPKRLPNYRTILQKYIAMDIISRIILIWNNQKVLFPFKTTEKTIVINSEINSMNNRFNVFDLVHTDSVLVIDDDVLISENLLVLMLYKWSQNKDRLVGLDSRHVNSKNEYVFRGNNPTLIVGKTMLFDRKYLKEYMEDEPLVKWNKYRFCEDISMNFLIFKTSKLRPLIVKQTQENFRIPLPAQDSTSNNTNSWKYSRTECVRWLSDYFNISMRETTN